MLLCSCRVRTFAVMGEPRGRVVATCGVGGYPWLQKTGVTKDLLVYKHRPENSQKCQELSKDLTLWWSWHSPDTSVVKFQKVATWVEKDQRSVSGNKKKGKHSPARWDYKVHNPLNKYRTCRLSHLAGQLKFNKTEQAASLVTSDIGDCVHLSKQVSTHVNFQKKLLHQLLALIVPCTCLSPDVYRADTIQSGHAGQLEKIFWQEALMQYMYSNI